MQIKKQVQIKYRVQENKKNPGVEDILKFKKSQ